MKEAQPMAVKILAGGQIAPKHLIRAALTPDARLVARQPIRSHNEVVLLGCDVT